MKKIPTLFLRDEANRARVTDTPNPDCTWVLQGEGVATKKWDGTSCLVRRDQLYKRYDAKHGKLPPPGFEPVQDPDPITGHWPGWLWLSKDDRWHLLVLPQVVGLEDGTYELCGPAINGNPDKFASHVLIKHGVHVLPVRERTYAALGQYLVDHPMEGLVFHHPDGRMAKLKSCDLGLPWATKEKR